MFNYSGRLFTFGCSFTNYRWPTWADILGRKFSYYENWGSVKGGNQWIFNSLVECILRNNLTSNDTVMVMWTGTNRVDTYIDNKWVHSGNLINLKNDVLFDKNYIKKFFDHRGFLIRDLAAITAAMHMLESKKIPYYFLALSSFNELLSWGDSIISPDLTDVYEVYQETIKKINPGAFEVIYKGDWLTRLPRPNPRKITKKHIDLYFEKQAESDIYDQLKGSDWPTFEDYRLGKFENCTDFIKKELADYRLTEQKFIKINSKKLQDALKSSIENAVGMTSSAHGDFHLTPSEALEYLIKTFPDWQVDDETKNWANDYTTKILDDRLFEVLMTWRTSNMESIQPKIRL